MNETENDIVLIGLNHKTASVEIRECIAFSTEDTVRALTQIKKEPLIKEAMLFSTCNRVELLLTVSNPPHAIEAAKAFIADFKVIPVPRFEKALYVHQGEDAVRHVFRVAASLDSLMVGEPQILGQIKAAYRLAADTELTGVILNRIMHRAFSVAKRVRTETGIGGNAVSISYAAVELARKIFGNLSNKHALLIGAGEMAELAIEHLIRHHVQDITVANRTFKNGVDLAKRFNGHAIRVEEIVDSLAQVDIIVSSTGAPAYVLTLEQVKGMMRRRKNRPLFFIDIAVPRDIDPAINRLNNVYVYDIDDLKGVIDENKDEREREALKGERLVDEAVIGFLQWYQTLEVVPTIVALRQKLETIVQSELEKTTSRLHKLNDDEQAAIQKMSDALINKILHHPTRVLKRNTHVNKSLYLDITRQLFNLDN